MEAKNASLRARFDEVKGQRATQERELARLRQALSDAGISAGPASTAGDGKEAAATKIAEIEARLASTKGFQMESHPQRPG